MLSKIPSHHLLRLFVGLSIASNLLKFTGVLDAPASALTIDNIAKPAAKIPMQVEVWCDKFFKQQRRDIAKD